ncbi:hypothetical protein JJC03_15585 [Flavobacterium oreochromis]|uniref:hypothetical protein n=1 Tax=Flavobacterium oreochromis TaxID=2906078 RepID=UPI001CE551CF|nr:hypothetical protein [Flavobacterium oreochromis]QYS86321.1 hypothetical protein JJC03_15585 [Flavobacterium oreochromis]
MILSFSTQLKGHPTLFPEKILSGLLKEYEIKENQLFKEVPDFIYNYGEFTGYHSADCILQVVDQSTPKIHTIREDKKERWKLGVKIDFFINSRKPDMFRFAPVLPGG